MPRRDAERREGDDGLLAAGDAAGRPHVLGEQRPDDEFGAFGNGGAGAVLAPRQSEGRPDQHRDVVCAGFRRWRVRGVAERRADDAGIAVLRDRRDSATLTGLSVPSVEHRRARSPCPGVGAGTFGLRGPTVDMQTGESAKRQGPGR